MGPSRIVREPGWRERSRSPATSRLAPGRRLRPLVRARRLHDPPRQRGEDNGVIQPHVAPRAAAPIGGAIVTGAPPALATFLIALDLGCGEQHQTRFSPARPGLAPGASYEELELLDDDRDDELDDPPPPDELLLDELLELPVLDDELDDELVDEPLDELLVLDELLDGELDELLEGELDELDDDVLPPLDELPCCSTTNRPAR